MAVMRAEPISILLNENFRIDKKIYFISGNEKTLMQKIKSTIIKKYQKNTNARIIKFRNTPFKKSKKIKSASKKEIQSMLSLCVKNLDEINFFRPKEKRPKMLENLRNIFYKMELSDKETRILSGVFASLGKKR